MTKLMHCLKNLFCNHGLLLVLLLALSLAGCGKKEWPRVEEPEQRFHFVEVNGALRGDCLIVDAELGGNVANLDVVTLELAVPDDCLTCPFRTGERISMTRTDAPDAFATGSFTLSYCGLAPGTSLRWRLVGKNKVPGLPPVLSEESVAE